MVLRLCSEQTEQMFLVYSLKHKHMFVKKKIEHIFTEQMFDFVFGLCYNPTKITLGGFHAYLRAYIR